MHKRVGREQHSEVKSSLKRRFCRLTNNYRSKLLSHKSGDTLVEVALAIGIFSMVAIAVTAVLTSSSSGAQSALETTLAREEIDTQAEALRFVQTAYSTNRNATASNAYSALWRKITSKAIDLNTVGTKSDEILNYTPSSCSDLYSDDSIVKDYMFILNTKKLGDLTTDTVDDVFISGSDKLKPASVNPRLIYVGANNADTSSSQDLLVDDDYTNLYRAEGIYVIAVKDARTTNIVDVTDGLASQESAYYDFYIRTCWYSTNSSQPSAISTVIRLYDPDVLQNGGTIKVDYNYSKTTDSAWPADFGNTDPNLAKTFASQGPARKVTVRDVDDILGWDFKWKDKTTGETFSPNVTITNPDSSESKYYQLQPAWEHRKYTITYDLNYPYASSGGVVAPNDQICYQDTGCQLVTKDSSVRPTASGYILQGWCTVSTGIDEACTKGEFYALDYSFPAGANFPTSAFSDSGRTLNLYAVWGEHGETITIKTTWTTNTDYDSYIYGTTFRGLTFNCYFGTKTPTETVNGITRTLATLDHDGRGNINRRFDETFTINTLGGRAYYFSIKNYSRNYYIYDDITITVSGPELGTKVYRSTNKTNCLFWNVFAYEDGQIIERNTCSRTAERGY